MTSNGPPATATGKDAAPYSTGGTTALCPGAVVTPLSAQTPYQIARACVEKGNIAICKVNVLKRARRAAGQSGEEPVSDDEEELVLPVLADFVSMFAPSPVVLPEPDADDHTSPGTGDGEVYGSPYPEEMGAEEHQEWNEGVSPSAANDANVARSQVVDVSVLCTYSHTMLPLEHGIL